MRDTLTALAGVVILILIAALAAPPFIDWAGQRDLIDRTLAASLGVPVRSEGRISVRLLPSPRLQLERVQLGTDDPAKPALDARRVDAELSLTPLIKGEFRFTETEIGRAELRLPVAEGDAILIPSDFARDAAARDLVIEDLRIAQALVTTIVPATGRTDQFLAGNLQIKAPSLAGPWQAEGTSGNTPFRIATSAFAPDGGLTIKLSGGGEGNPRFEAEARVALKPAETTAGATGAARPLVPEAEGTARIVVAASKAAPATLPYILGGKFKSRGAMARFESVSAEIDPAGQSLRLTGSGHADLRSWRAGLNLESRRINLDGLIYAPSSQALLGRIASGSGLSLPIMLDLDLKVESLALGFEEWSDALFRGTFDRSGGLVLRRLTGNLAGGTKIAASGDVEFAPVPRFSGHVDVEAANSEGLGRSLRQVGLKRFGLDLLDGRAFRLSGDVAAAAQETKVDGLRLALGETLVTGRARYVRADAGSRGRFEADLDAQGLDIGELPPLSGFLDGLDRHDLVLKLAGRDVRYGSAAPGKGTIATAIQSDGSGLVVDKLDITDLAGANAKLSGRIAADGTGRVAGRVSAPVAAPLVALLQRVWLPEARLVPRFLREGALDLEISVAREPQQAEALRTALKGTAAGSDLDANLLTRSGRIAALDATIAGPSAAAWFGRADIAGLRQPARLMLAAKRSEGETALSLDAKGTLAGLTLATPEPIRIAADDAPPDSGKLRIATADLGPFLILAGSAALPEKLPADLSLTLARKGDALQADVTGEAGGGAVSAQVERRADGSLAGRAALTRLSLPALAAATVLPEAEGRFAPVPEHPRTELSLDVDRLELGRGFTATKARLGLILEGGSLTLRGLAGALADGRLTGSATLTRQEGTASISGEGQLNAAALGALASDSAVAARLTTGLRYSTTGDTLAALEANLGGSGEVTLSDLRVPDADPGALDRALDRALGEDDPLREGRMPGLLAEEFAAGALAAKEPVKTSVTLAGATLRSAPLTLDLGPARWNGSFAFDLRRRRLEARGTLVSGAVPKGWTGGRPSVQLGFSGPLAAPQREVDPGPLTNGLAALVLQRELEKIELADADGAERQRRRARIEMDKARAAALKAAADKAAQEKAAAEEAARQARLRAQQAAAEEQARRERAQAEEEAKRAKEAEQPPPYMNNQPLDIRPPAANSE